MGSTIEVNLETFDVIEIESGNRYPAIFIDHDLGIAIYVDENKDAQKLSLSNDE